MRSPLEMKRGAHHTAEHLISHYDYIQLVDKIQDLVDELTPIKMNMRKRASQPNL